MRTVITKFAMPAALAIVLSMLIAPLAVIAQRAPRGETPQLQSPQDPKLGFMIHGGAGVIRRGSLSPEREKEYMDKLREAVMAGYKALQAGRSGLDAVEIAIRMMEDSPLFNAGKGAVFTNEGKNELDASIMDGKTLAAGAVAGLRQIKNPITLARAVMEKSPHVMMIGEGAEKFARSQNIEFVPEKYFWTQKSWDAIQKLLNEPKPAAEPAPKPKGTGEMTVEEKERRKNNYGTVGAVALDKDGNIAAGTSTGGMTNKRFGRVGDVPIIGAGTYANNNTCAVSATGWGEYFIRLTVARDIASLMEYRALPIQNAADQVIKRKLQDLGGDGGIIAIDKLGNMAISFNSEGMYRAYIDKEGKPVVEIY
jgi:L-asparaginase / beta-aspartyl-peptidase